MDETKKEYVEMRVFKSHVGWLTKTVLTALVGVLVMNIFVGLQAIGDMRQNLAVLTTVQSRLVGIVDRHDDEMRKVTERLAQIEAKMEGSGE